jgi:hypothetical protein
MKKVSIAIFITVPLVIVAVLFNSNITLRYLFRNKVWAHKVNSIEKLNKIQNKFTGIEFDVIFYNNKEGVFFDINHPPDSSTNLSLTKYLQLLPETCVYKFWIDFKNLKQDNELLSSIRLDSIATAFDINKGNIIVESIRPWCLEYFKEKGFRTSYYLPSDLHTLDPVILHSTIEKISKTISLYRTDYISADYKDYLILKKYFPEKKKIFWFTTYGTMNISKARILLYKILTDDKVDVLLIPC